MLYHSKIFSKKSHSHGLAKVISTLTLTMFLASGVTLAASNLTLNSRGDDVLVLQQRLRKAGYTTAKESGVFDNNTKRAVLAFQRDNKLKITGVVDSSTWDAIEKAPAASKSVPSVGNPSSSIVDTGSTSSSSSSANKISSATTGTTPINKYRIGSSSEIKTTKQGLKVVETSPFLSKTKVNSVISTAKKYIGVPYQFGGTTPKAFDCSGYLQYVFAQNGYTIPRTADEQYKLGKKTTNTKQLVPGDLVFFTTYEAGASHCGIYLGNGQFIHTSTSKGVRIDKLDDSYWKPRYFGGKHIVK